MIYKAPYDILDLKSSFGSATEHFNTLTVRLWRPIISTYICTYKTRNLVGELQKFTFKLESFPKRIWENFD